MGKFEGFDENVGFDDAVKEGIELTDGVLVGLAEGTCEMDGEEECIELGCTDFVGVEVGVEEGKVEMDGICVGEEEKLGTEDGRRVGLFDGE